MRACEQTQRFRKTKTVIIRPTQAADTPHLQQILNRTELFPPEFLPEILGAYLRKPNGPVRWLSADIGGDIVGFCYAEPEPMTDGTWNMRALAVTPFAQRQGVGSGLATGLADELSRKGGRVLIVDTSSTEAFASARAFYFSCGYVLEARIRDFWSDGDDKIVFHKALV